MLDIQTKRNIDTARDILVGKVPDPKSQVEQITIALMYKFMEDMDKESVEMGGNPSFFTGEYEPYTWSKLLDPSISGMQMLNLYSEAIVKFYENPNFPKLFRDIFKNANLPYRDPETLKLFLKTINDFQYDHSERLGDAYEYLLSILGSQGDAGQFRTPRHIIDFMVEIVDPQKNETILDPACGTAGFLISSYKYILKQNTKKIPGDLLTSSEKEKILSNFKGYDISPDMVRLSLMNMYLHGFVQPQIIEYDTLTSEDRWNEYADVILANPPFMTPKGGIRPHKKFSIQSNRSEVLFVDYIAEHLTSKGRAGVIVPEGIIFQSANAYKSLRKMLVENYLYAVVSLPAGVFQPYSGVKTSILLMDRQLAKKTDAILFVKIENDGYDLGAQRRPIDKNDLPDAIKVIKEYIDSIKNDKPESFIAEDKPCNALLVKKEDIAENGEYNLTGERYRNTNEKKSHKWPMVELGTITLIKKGTPITKATIKEGNIPVIAGGKEPAYYHNESNRQGNVITISASGAYAGYINYFKKPIFASDCTTIQSIDEEKLNSYFLYWVLKSKQDVFYSFQKGVGQPHVYAKDFVNFQIPLPPIEVQREIVDEIEGYQKLIDGCRQVVEAWKPQIEIDPSWPMVELGEVCEVTSSKRIYQNEYVSSGIPFYRSKEIVELSQGKHISVELFITEEKYIHIKKHFDVPKINDILITAVGTIGISWLVSDNRKFYFKDGNIIWLKNFKSILPKYIKIILDNFIKNNLHILTNGAAYNAMTISKLKKLIIPLPPIEVQREIVEKIEAEQKVIDGCRELIKTYEEKIKRIIDKVWE